MRNNIFKSIVTTILMAFSIMSYAQVSDSILDDEYVMSQTVIEAKVLKKSVRNRTITVRGEEKGQTRQFTIPQGAKISVNGRTAKLSDIRKGDVVYLAMQPKLNRVSVASISIPQTPVTLETRRATPVAAAPVMQETLPRVLPKTGSNLFLLLLLGMLLIVVSGGMGMKRRIFSNK